MRRTPTRDECHLFLTETFKVLNNSLSFFNFFCFFCLDSERRTRARLDTSFFDRATNNTLRRKERSSTRAERVQPSETPPVEQAVEKPAETPANDAAASSDEPSIEPAVETAPATNDAPPMLDDTTAVSLVIDDENHTTTTTTDNDENHAHKADAAAPSNDNDKAPENDQEEEADDEESGQEEADDASFRRRRLRNRDFSGQLDRSERTRRAVVNYDGMVPSVAVDMLVTGKTTPCFCGENWLMLSAVDDNRASHAKTRRKATKEAQAEKSTATQPPKPLLRYTSVGFW